MLHRFGTWLFGDDGQQTTRKIACATATLGILSGYALYILWWQQEEQGESGWKFAAAFAAAALMSFAFEVLRGAIEGNTHPWSRSRVVSTIVMLAAFELFIIASHTAAELYPQTFIGVAGFIFGEQFPNQNPGLNLLALGFLWVFVALTIVYKLRRFIAGWPYPDSKPLPGESLRQYLSGMAPDLWRGAKAGFTAGVFWGTVSAIAYVFAWRLYLLAQWIHGNYSAWWESLNTGGPLHLHGWLFLAVYGPAMLAGWGAKYLGGFGLFAGIFAVTMAARSMVSAENRPLATIWPAATVLLLLGAPILTAPGARHDLLLLAYLSAVIWGVPATLLGLLAPLLRRPSHHPPVWGLVASAAAGVTLLVTVARFHSPAATGTEKGLLLFATAALLVLAFALFRGVWSEEFWLCVALSIGTIVWGTTSLVQQVNLFDVQKRAHTLIALPLGASAPSADPYPELAILPYLFSRQNPIGGSLFPDSLARLFPGSMSDSQFIVNPCAFLRGLAPQQHDVLARNITKAAADNRDTARADAALVEDATQKLERMQQFHVTLLARVQSAPSGAPGARISQVRAWIRELADHDKNLRDWQAWVDKNKGVVYNGHGHTPACGTKLDPLIEDLERADNERAAAASSIAQTAKRVGQQLQADSAQMVSAGENLAKERDDLQITEAQHLELTMASSLGFWVTIGLLAIWRLTQPPEPD